MRYDDMCDVEMELKCFVAEIFPAIARWMATPKKPLTESAEAIFENHLAPHKMRGKYWLWSTHSDPLKEPWLGLSQFSSHTIDTWRTVRDFNQRRDRLDHAAL